jgi:hypothetical protein
MKRNSNEIAPGSFHISEEWDDPDKLREDENTPEWDRSDNYAKVKEIRSVPGLVKEYSLFRDYFHPKDDVVYYPCCGGDISPTTAFPKSRVIYLDYENDSIGAREGFEFHKGSAFEFDPGAVDILIFQNPQISPEIPCSHVALGGYVLSNNYHDTAYKISKIDGWQLCALIENNRDGEMAVVTDDLEAYISDVETEDEFMNSKPGSLHAIDYNTAADIVESVTGKRENVLAEYKKILAGKEYVSLPNILIPKKKAPKGDLFVFQKVR